MKSVTCEILCDEKYFTDAIMSNKNGVIGAYTYKYHGKKFIELKLLGVY
jgi:hypothetical protein